MLRRRIFASAMASVMALSSVAVVASADDTAVAEKNVVGKADLQKLIDDTMSMRDDAIYNYGTHSGQNFLDALEYADNILENTNATATDYTVAYKMVVETKENLRLWNADDLKTLLDNCKKIYETDNILNEELGDLIYDDDTFTDFVVAYDEAERVINSTDTRIITDAYDELDHAKKSLKALPSVTKSQFRAALKAYEALTLKEKDYDTWRRGKFTADWVSLNNGNYWMISDKSVDYYTLFDYVMGTSLVSIGMYNDTDPKVEFKWGDPGDDGTYGWKYGYFGNFLLARVKDGDWFEGLGRDIDVVYHWNGKSVYDYINEQYKIFDEIKTSSKTTNEEIVKAAQAAEDAVSVFNAWSADDTNRATKSSVQKLLDQYHAQLVAKYNQTSAEELYTLLTGNAAGDWTDADNKYFGAALKNDGDKKKIDVDADGYWTNDPAKAVKKVDVAKRVDILKYIRVDYTMVDPAVDYDLYWALEIAYKYLVEEAWDDDVYGLDEIGSVAVAKGSVAEWTLVNRFLKYRLEDMFNGKSAESHTRADVKALISDAYDLAEKTGDAAIFADLHMALVNARQDAIDWLAAANAVKTYKDGDAVYGMTATEVYKDLKKAYKELDDELAKYKYSYGEIYNYISDVSELLDDEEIKPAEDVVKALKDTAYYLSIVEPSGGEDNEAFTSDREFKAHNRLYTYVKDGKHQGTDSEKNLMESYEALVAAVKKQTEAAAVVVGDVNGDGAVNAADATEILKANVGLRDAIDVAVGDVNADGVVNAADATQILKTLIGL